MEPEHSLPRLQQFATYPHSEPEQYSPYPIPLPEDPFQYYPLIYAFFRKYITFRLCLYVKCKEKGEIKRPCAL